MTEEEVIGGEVQNPAPCLSLSSGKHNVVFSLLFHHHVHVPDNCAKRDREFAGPSSCSSKLPLDLRGIVSECDGLGSNRLRQGFIPATSHSVELSTCSVQLCGCLPFASAERLLECASLLRSNIPSACRVDYVLTSTTFADLLEEFVIADHDER